MTKTISEMTTAEMLAEYNALTGKSVKKFSSRAAGEKQLAAARNAANQAALFGSSEPSEPVAETQPDAAEVPVEQAEASEPSEPVAETEAETAETEPTEDAHEANEVGQEAQPKQPKVRKSKKTKAEPIEAKCPKCGQTEDQTPAGLPNTVAGDKRRTCQHCVTEYWLANGEVFDPQTKKEQRAEAIANSWKNPEVAEARAMRTNVAVEGYGTYRSVKAAFQALDLPLSRHIGFRMKVKKEGFATFRLDGRAYNFSVVS